MDWVLGLKNLQTDVGTKLFDEPLSRHTYFKIGGPARALVIPKNLNELMELATFCEVAVPRNVPLLLIGFGSNLLVRDEGFPGLVVKMTQLSLLIENESEAIRVGSGVSVAHFLRTASKNGWGGFEFLSGIPGTFGGVIAMNGGTHLGEASKSLLAVRTFNLKKTKEPIKIYRGKELRFGYRKNHFLGPEEIIIDSLWKKEDSDPESIRTHLDTLYRRRKETQPLDYPSCGSVFKNPETSGLKAWEVIDRLGLRGHRIGNAMFAEKHSNWILNLGNASASDVIALIHLAKAKALQDLGITLIEEVRIIP